MGLRVWSGGESFGKKIKTLWGGLGGGGRGGVRGGGWGGGGGGRGGGGWRITRGIF